MGRNKILKSTAGLTMIELMITAAIFSSSMVLLSGTMITFTSHNTIAEQKATTTAFNRSVFEDIRGLGINGILSYEVPVDNPELGTVFIPGMGEARVNVWAVIPQINEAADPDAITDPNLPTQTSTYDRWFLMGVDDPLSVTDPPNPIEIVVEVAKASAGSANYNSEGGIEFSSSTMISY